MDERPIVVRGQSQLAKSAFPEPNFIPLGSAHWISEGTPAIKPYRKGDFLLGKWDSNQTAAVRDDRHVLIVCGTRGGKGISVVVPNLLFWPGTIVVIDPKGENALVTARRRGTGSDYCSGMNQKVCILDPFNAVRARDDSYADLKAAYNPLDLIRADRPESLQDAGRIADACFTFEGTGDTFFEENARDFTKYLILHVATDRSFKANERNLVTVQRLMMAGDEKTLELAEASGDENASTSGFVYLFEAMKRNRVFDGVISRAARGFAELHRESEKTFGGIVQSARRNLSFLEDMSSVLSHSTFSLSELKTNRQGVSLYLTLPQRYMETHFRWLRMMTTLVVTECERVSHQPACGHQILMVLDEFPALKRMKVIENAAAQIAGFGVKLVMVAQTLAQLSDIYKANWETLVANAGIKMFFSNEDNFTRDYASKMAGDYEVTRIVRSHNASAGTSTSHSDSKSTGTSAGISMSGTILRGTYTQSYGVSQTDSSNDNRGTNQSESSGYSETVHRRPLIAPDEVGRIFGNPSAMRALVFISGYGPACINRLRYFDGDAFEGRYDRHPDHKPPEKLIEVAERKETKRRFALVQEEQMRLYYEEKRIEKAQAAALKRKLRMASIRGFLEVMVFGIPALLLWIYWLFGSAPR